MRFALTGNAQLCLGHATVPENCAGQAAPSAPCQGELSTPSPNPTPGSAIRARASAAQSSSSSPPPPPPPLDAAFLRATRPGRPPPKGE
eukprot:14023652-Alexandrium_andersonii.AAC.1